MTEVEALDKIKNSGVSIRSANDYYDLCQKLGEYAKPLSLEYNDYLLSDIIPILSESDRADVINETTRLKQQSLLYGAWYCFDKYLLYLEWARDPEKKFYAPRRKTLKLIVDEMQKIADDELDLLCISLPPGSGKSTLNIFFLTWIMGKYPDQPNLASAHSDKLTRSYYDGIISILTDPDYLWSDVFPGVRIAATNAKDESIDLNKNKRFKTLTCRSIGGSLTGATRCERVLVADDLVSGIEEALSKQRMDSLWEAYTNDLKTRKKENCKEIHIATRWSVHDCIGRLERQYADDPRTKFISIPALNENEESNFDYSGGVGFSTKYFIDMKESLDDVSWRCLFQQEPIEREGLLYHTDELKRYFELPKNEDGSLKQPDAILSICDTKTTGTDYAFQPIGYVYGEDHYIEDCVLENKLRHTVEVKDSKIGESQNLDAKLALKLMEHNVQQARYESNNAGSEIAKDVQKILKEKGSRTHLTAVITSGNKNTKIIVNSNWVKEHCLFKASSVIPKNGEYAKMLNFLTSYTMSGKNAFDDVPDGMAMYALYAQSLKGSVASVFRRPF